MSASCFRAILGLVLALAMLSMAEVSFAQPAPAPQQAVPSSPSQLPPAPAIAPSQATVQGASTDAATAPLDSVSRSVKSTTVTLRELSPWSMFLSADIVVKAVMIGLAIASLVTWTIFIAKMIVRAEARRIRLGMGLLATIGATSPFIGLFGTVWGIMNSFIGISKSQTTNLAVVAPGIAEALLATAIGLVAAIPAVIIYNHFSRMTKGYLELVSRASGASARLLSRDLDRSHGSLHTRAAE